MAETNDKQSTEQTEMSTKYDPTAIEKGRYNEWLDEGVFKPSGDKKKPNHSQLFYHHQMLLESCILAMPGTQLCRI